MGQGTQAVTTSSDSEYYPVYSKMNLEIFVQQTQETTGRNNAKGEDGSLCCQAEGGAEGRTELNWVPQLI